MNDQTKSTEKKYEKINDMINLRESLKLKNFELDEESKDTLASNLCMYDLILLNNSILNKESITTDITSGIKDNYELTTLAKPFICIGKKSLIVVINFGIKPKDNQGNFIKANYFIPINYKAKRLFDKHNKIGEPGNMFYTCKVTAKKNIPVYSIVTDDGLRFIGGKEIFKEFSGLFGSNFDFKNIDDFFGITEVGIQKKLEAREFE
ncbi:F Y rich protein [Tubulinosema ratisbonensis]|uniref:F Y rich protein n=1 Tax=Tubulinosema ratisbonensis TaxID=291195 RepID=A0A437AL64_9MICR|nr:F Y rich protein [Tubulinosema ratisbonensis]